jgi:Domain of unknown function (DUF397)
MDLTDARWRKSTYSGPQECVEVTFGVGEIGVRDSKNPTGGALVLPEPGWRAMNASFSAASALNEAFIAPTAPR